MFECLRNSILLAWALYSSVQLFYDGVFTFIFLFFVFTHYSAPFERYLSISNPSMIIETQIGISMTHNKEGKKILV